MSKRVSRFLLLIIPGIILVLATSSTKNEDPKEAQAQANCGIMAYDWNGPVTEADKGFPKQQPPINNFNWRSPVNYAQGTLYYRAEVRSQPVVQNMRLQQCFWQPKIGETYKFGNEECGPTASVRGTPGNVVTWGIPVDGMWEHPGGQIDWGRERFRTAIAIKNTAGLPVSNYNGWNWNGENPNAWYPLNIRFTTVVVPPGGNFCGWNYYLGLPTVTPNLSVTVTPTGTGPTPTPPPPVRIIGPKTPTPNYNESECRIVVGATTQYKTIQSGINAASSGDKICVRNGTYKEIVNIDKTNIHLIGESADKTIIDGEFLRPGTLGVGQGPGAANCGEDQSNALKINPLPAIPNSACSSYSSLVDIRASGVIFEGFTVDRSRGRAIRLTNGDNRMNNITVRNIIVPISRRDNIAIYKTDNSTIVNSDLAQGASFAQYSRGGQYLNHPAGGIGLANSSNILITNNIIHEGWGEMILADVQTFGSHSITIQDNIMYDSMSALYLHGIKKVLFQRNLLYNTVEGKNDGRRNSLSITPSESHFDNFISSEDVVVINNIFALTSDSPTIRFGVSGPAPDGVDGVDVYNNTFYSDSPDDTTAHFVGNIVDIKVRNNIFYHKLGKPTFPENQRLGNASFSVVSNNCWSDTPPDRLKGQGSMYNCNPQFVGSDGNGTIPELHRGQVRAEWFKLKNTSPVINKGANLSLASITWNNNDRYVIDDYWTGARPFGSAYDIGAHEFGSSVNVSSTPTPVTSPTPTIPTAKTDRIYTCSWSGDRCNLREVPNDCPGQANELDCNMIEDSPRCSKASFDCPEPTLPIIKPVKPNNQVAFCDGNGKPVVEPVPGDYRINTAIGCIPISEDLNATIGFILRWGVGIVGGIGLLITIYAAFMIMTSQNDPKRVQAAKELLVATITGIILIIFGLYIVRIMGVEVLGIPGL